MSKPTFQRWLNECIVGFVNYSEDDLIRLLFKSDIQSIPHGSNLKQAIETTLNKGSSKLDTDKAILMGFLEEHLTSLTKRLKAFGHTNLAFRNLIKLFQEERGYAYINVVKEYAKKLFGEGIKSSNLGEIVNSLRMFISSCQVTRPLPYSQVIGLYYALNMAFKTSFRINNLQNFTSLLRIVNNEHSKLPSLDNYPKAQQVEFKYYEGRFHIYEQELNQAEECFDFAFRLCDKDSFRNKRLVLRYLIPVRAYKGIFPTQALLVKYKLTDLSEVLTSLKQGNIELFNRTLEANQDKFIKQGIYIMLESLQLLAYRNLFKRTQSILKTTHVKLSSFSTVLAVAGVKSISLLDVECILVNLINKKWIKGYISSSQKTVVFSKVDPFPKITEISD
ncbi:hypothetical protein SteCoe_22735 [Stentor coeruleus]|uniref:PCI domain-containing protein n=1 Tax=Stentor coeruleus TaxID=5963 RepID=A0A1R2BLE7_9CILI|nr:hypothetical protein SteCoe_22735 [Stentor coeruleus]